MKSFVTVLFVVYELYLCESQGISAGTPVFVLNGDNLLLNVTKAVVLGEFDLFFWNFNKSIIVTFNSKGKKVSANYTVRLEFPVNNYSVILKNLQEADSGVYTAEVTKEEVAKYNVKVQDRVSPVNLTVVNNSVSRSSSSCSFTVTCSSQDSHINSTFTCETRTCSQEGGERSEGILDNFLQVHQSSGSIICNHSNHVSWTNDTITIKDVCHQRVCCKRYNVYIIVACGYTSVLAVLFFRSRESSNRGILENTVYSSALPGAPARTQDPTDDEDSAPPLSSTYACVGPHTGPAAPTETRNTAPIESVYAEVKNTTPGP